MRQEYAAGFNKEYLQYLGITHVSENGKEIWKGDKLVNQQPHKRDGYLRITLYDPIKRQGVPLAERTNTTGNVILGVHRIVWVWYNNFIPNGLVVDHKNKNRADNRLENLQLLTPGENIWKDRTCNVREIKCKLKRPREYYEEKLEYYEELYNRAKEAHNEAEAHKQRTNIANMRGKLRYWDTHSSYIIQQISAKLDKETEKMENRAAKEQLKRDLGIINELKKQARESGDKHKWHMLCTIAKNWANYDQNVREETMKCLLKR